VKKATLMFLATVVHLAVSLCGRNSRMRAPFSKNSADGAMSRACWSARRAPLFGAKEESTTFTRTKKAPEGYASGRFPDGSVIVYDVLQTKEIADNSIEGPTPRMDVRVKQSVRDRTTGGS